MSKPVMKQFRNRNDFLFGSFYIDQGHNWISIHGRLKDKECDSQFMRIEWI